MNVGVLIRAEVIKIAKLRGFWIVLGAYIAFLGVISDSMLDGRTPPALPASWPAVMEFFKPITTLLLASILVITVPSEFLWRTARQNVIDGLSKTEWWTAKLLLIAMMSALFLTVGLSVVLGYQLMAGPEPVDGQLLRANDVKMLGAYLLTLSGWLSFGYFLSLAIRNPGAVALFFLTYVLFLDTIVVQLLRLKEYTRASQFFLGPVFNEVSEARRWHPDLYARLQALGRIPEDLFTNQQQILLALAYILLFLLASYLVLQKRDM